MQTDKLSAKGVPGLPPVVIPIPDHDPDHRLERRVMGRAKHDPPNNLARRASRMEYYVRNSEGGFLGDPHPTLEDAQHAARAAKDLTGEDYSVCEIRFVWSTKDA